MNVKPGMGILLGAFCASLVMVGVVVCGCVNVMLESLGVEPVTELKNFGVSEVSVRRLSGSVNFRGAGWCDGAAATLDSLVMELKSCGVSEGSVRRLSGSLNLRGVGWCDGAAAIFESLVMELKSFGVSEAAARISSGISNLKDAGWKRGP